MQYTLRIAGTAPDTAAIERALQAIDPAAMVDIDAAGGTLRVATSMGDDELATMLRAGFALDPRQLERVPSECCGGCGG
jgi:hypothetical protein